MFYYLNLIYHRNCENFNNNKSQLCNLIAFVHWKTIYTSRLTKDVLEYQNDNVWPRIIINIRMIMLIYSLYLLKLPNFLYVTFYI